MLAIYFTTAILCVVVSSHDNATEPSLMEQQTGMSEVLRIGNKKKDDKLIDQSGSTWRYARPNQMTHLHTFTGDNNSTISQVLVRSEFPNTEVSLVSGGPGFTYVTLSFEFSSNGQVQYLLELYGSKKFVLDNVPATTQSPTRTQTHSTEQSENLIRSGVA